MNPAIETLVKRGTSGWSMGILATAVAISSFYAATWTRQTMQTVEPTESPGAKTEEPVQPIEVPRKLDAKKVWLGRKLFSDNRLSHNNQISCASCHILREGGTDHKVRSIAIQGAEGVINTPTVLNSGLNFSQFWDGRAATLEEQVDEPVQSKTEMGSTWPEVITKLGQSHEYVAAFRQAFGGKISRDSVKTAIAEFERSLVTPNSRFDLFLRGNQTALTSQEQEGYGVFKSFGCVSCHQGANLGGNMYQTMGVMAPYFTDRGRIVKADQGRFNVTGDPRDRYMFKVPSLRNVALTAPYFHDGSAATLEKAVTMMAKYQLGHPLDDQETALIVTFLKTLTGQLSEMPL